ncbi:MAG: hypothetical protein AAF492_21615, partial [Verrucomicrobiota bacterium]
VPPGGPPQGPGPSREIYQRMGEENIFKMCEDFYGELEKSELRPMFPEDMKESSKRTAAFIVGLTGGPPLYQQLYGPPMMRRRHMPFAIDENARQTWLNCFKAVLEQAEINYRFPPEHLPGFIAFLERFSAWMVNRKPERDPS